MPRRRRRYCWLALLGCCGAAAAATAHTAAAVCGRRQVIEAGLGHGQQEQQVGSSVGAAAGRGRPRLACAWGRGSGQGAVVQAVGGRLRRAFRLNWLPARSDAAWQSQPCQDRRLVAGGGTTVSLAAGRRRPQQQLTGLALLQPLAQRPRPLSLLLALLPPFGIGRGAAGRPGPQRDHRRRGEAIWWP